MENLTYSRDYKTLYKVQDKILQLIKDKDLGLYLTGGTALHRFYYEFRYSEDLDFFAVMNSSANSSFKSFVDLLEDNKIEFYFEVNAKDFKRLIVDKTLKIDLVNDVVKHFGDINKIDGIYIDNIENIFTNKLTAMFDREAIRDVFDLYILLKNNKFDMQDTIKSLDEKTNITIDLMYAKLLNFPIEKVSKTDVDFKTIQIYKEFKEEYLTVIKDFFEI